MTIITLLSDFGLRDSYVAEMKGVIFSICPNANIVDVTHEVDNYDIKMGMFVLASVASRFPDGTIHVAVVDPGVGGTRRPVMVKAKKNCYIGPDNGVLILAARNEGIENVYRITNENIFNKRISATFHGRDIFARTAAHVANGLKYEKVGKEINDYLIPEFPKIEINGGMINCEIIHIDGFGNLVTNVYSKDLKILGMHVGSNLMLKVKNSRFDMKLCRTYSEVQNNELVALIGSHNFLEIAANLGSAKIMLKVERGDKLELVFID